VGHVSRNAELHYLGGERSYNGSHDKSVSVTEEKKTIPKWRITSFFLNFDGNVILLLSK
jgi:hypothetical protein